MLTQMGEQVAKEVKKCDKEALKAIKTNLNGAKKSQVGQNILEAITKIVSGKESASYAIEGIDVFDNEATLSSSVKKCDASKMPKEYLSTLAREITTDVEGQHGPLLRSLLEATAAADNLAFFPFYKVLFKLNQIGLTRRNWNSLKHNIEGKEKTITETKIVMSSLEDLMQNLEFHTKISEEIQRSKSNDIMTVHNKAY